MRAPSAGVPLPAGRPEPSGRMLMSQAAVSAGVISFPRFGRCGFGAWAKATLGSKATVSMRANPRRLPVYMLHLPAAFDRPTDDGVVVLADKGSHRRNFCGLS